MTQEEIIKKYDLKLLLLFGSRARGDARKDSDTDIAFFGNKRLDLKEKSMLMMDLTSFLRTDKIDIVDLREASPLIFYAITRDGKILYAHDMMFFYEIRTYAYKRYIETVPIYEDMFKQIKKRLAIL
mgnify:CR=1 FL=1